MGTPIDRIQALELQEAIRIKDWIGWKVGWLTGWHNPLDRLGEVVNPAEIGRLVTLHGEYMQRQGQLVQEFGSRLNEFTRGATRPAQAQQYQQPPPTKESR